MFIVFLIVWIVIVIGAFLTFDRLLYLQYSLYRKQWEQDGKPYGFFWIPPVLRRSGFWGFPLNSLAHRRVIFHWFFGTPRWIRDSPEARLWLYAWRSLMVLANAFILLPFALAIIYGEY